MQRLITYIDGFNLYFGLKSSHWERYLWLNVQRLSQNLSKPDQELRFTKYFTARISSPEDKRLRQSTYLDALLTLPDLRIYYGKYQMNPRRCRSCGFEDFVPNEKMTDVNIAVELLRDAFEDRFDSALLISADSDLVAPVSAIRDLFPAKRVVVAFPPNRSSVALKKVASAFLTIGRANFESSLFPPEVVQANGFVLRRPGPWK